MFEMTLTLPKSRCQQVVPSKCSRGEPVPYLLPQEMPEATDIPWLMALSHIASSPPLLGSSVVVKSLFASLL